MADLDDFFAKKDRKKKAVKKFATTDEVAKKLDDPKQKSDARPKKERPAHQEGEEGGRAGEEEEWKEYEETVKDYTGLKIQVLQGGNGQQESGRDSTSEDCAPDGSGKGKGPWNKPTEAEPAPPPPPKVEEPQRREVKPSAYVAPAQRNRPVEPLRRNQAKHAPDIHNDDTFPVLGANAAKRGGGWSTAGGSAAPAAAGRQPLVLGNRFTSLQDDS